MNVLKEARGEYERNEFWTRILKVLVLSRNRGRNLLQISDGSWCEKNKELLKVAENRRQEVT
jgi:hypothetical protein